MSSRLRWRRAIAVLALGGLVSSAGAAEMDGVRLPDTVTLDGSLLRLNGVGLRTATVFHVHVYVSALYLQHPSHNAQAILASSEDKLLEFHFVRNVGVEDIRAAWRHGFDANCIAPCAIPEDERNKFIAGQVALRAGDVSTFAWANGRLTIRLNGQERGVITDPVFARAVLATELGPHPATQALKRELLGLGES